MEVKIVSKFECVIPKYETEKSAGCDLKACIDYPVVLYKGRALRIPTGVHVQIPDGYEGQVRGRSGLNFKHDLVVPTGTIDSDYTGEIMVKIYNLGYDDYIIQPDERIAQLVFSPVVHAQWVEVEHLDETQRGENGFGSTGK